MTRPFKLSLVVEKAGADIKGLLLMDVKNRPGLLFDIVSKLREKNIRVLSYLVSDIEGEKTDAFLCVELTEPEVDCEALANKLKKITGASAIVWRDSPVPGFVPQPFFPIYSFGVRGVFLTNYILEGLFRRIREKVGAPVTRIVLYHAGKFAGLTRSKEARAERPDLSSRDLFKRFLLSGYAFGQYRCEIVEWEEGRLAVVRVWESWESEQIGKGYSEPQCNFIRGFLEGFLTGIFGKEFSSRERMCECMGDPYCEFEIKEKAV